MVRELSVLVVAFLIVGCVCGGFGEDGSSRRRSSRAKMIPNCGEVVLKSECREKSKCMWCISEHLDDMCFSKSEALRLPLQVFSCANLPSNNHI
ncbi:hypothetical protein VNO77_01124 [Canavalia gladiata]|uniref:Uncharacterized protein n=1 Tax=Canavalia gladiata TaxID=3824 RepID=A0AAN9MRC4_CANGL